MAISGLRESLSAHESVTKDYACKIYDIERDIRGMVEGEIAAAIAILNGKRNGVSVVEYKVDICEGIIVTVTRMTRKENSACMESGKVTDDEANDIRVFLMKEIESRLGITPAFYVMVQIPSCMITEPNYTH